MDLKQAIRIIQDRADIYGMSFLDTAIVMKELLEADELFNREAVAIRVFMREGRKLFAPV